VNVTQKTAISRRQFLTGAFRAREAAGSDAAGTAASSGDLARRGLDERGRFERNEALQKLRNFTALETAPQIPDWDSGLDRALAELENRKGIDDF
jgi:hypothetical protein